MIWHSSDIVSVLNELSVDSNTGLANGVAYERLNTYGKNQVSEVKPISFFKRFLSQLNRKSVYILVAITVVCLLVSNYYGTNGKFDVSSILILAIVLLNALITAFNQYSCDRALYKQKVASVPTCTVIREGIKRSIPSNEIVVGDIIELNEGDYISADVRLIETNGFRCNELALTGEIVPVEKDATVLLEDMVPCAGRKNMAFAGCNVMHGSAKAVVVETGINTEIGKSSTINEHHRTTVSGIERTLDKTSRIINITVIITCSIVFLIGVLFSIGTSVKFAAFTLETLLGAVALGVAAIPETLPYVAILITALGTGRLIHDGVIIKNISAIEKLAKTTVLCADKTGVFTKNHMTLNCVYNGESLESPVDDALEPKSAVVLRLAVSCSMLENDTTEAAIEEACIKYNKMSAADIGNAYPRLNAIPFDGERKTMTSINMIEGKPFAVIKGAPEVVIEKCINVDKDKLTEICDNLANRALRLICIAIKALDEIPANPDPSEIERDLKFAGIICLEDPPRPEACESIEFCKNTGINVVMITGDNIATASAIAKPLGILTDDSCAVTGAEIEEMSDDELKDKIKSYTVFARISPAQKLRIVNTFKEIGEVVAVTGNGRDDADVLSVADVGLAIGADGNDVARANADAIIKSNKFSYVAKVFKECHGLLENIKLTVHYLISCNASELLIYLFGLLIFKMPPLLPVQLLWINLLTDSAPAISLTMRYDTDVSFADKKKLLKGRFYDLNTATNMAVEAVILAICGLIAFAIGNRYGVSIAYTMAFLTVTLSQVFHSYNLRSNRSIIFTKFRRNEFMIYSTIATAVITAFLCLTSAGHVFGLRALSGGQFFVSLLLALIIIPACEIIKVLNHKFYERIR